MHYSRNFANVININIYMVVKSSASLRNRKIVALKFEHIQILSNYIREFLFICTFYIFQGDDAIFLYVRSIARM